MMMTHQKNKKYQCWYCGKVIFIGLERHIHKYNTEKCLENLLHYYVLTEKTTLQDQPNTPDQIKILEERICGLENMLKTEQSEIQRLTSLVEEQKI